MLNISIKKTSNSIPETAKMKRQTAGEISQDPKFPFRRQKYIPYMQSRLTLPNC